jgi:hypothetical protein
MLGNARTRDDAAVGRHALVQTVLMTKGVGGCARMHQARLPLQRRRPLYQ